MAEDQQDKKIKELEASLARELDQQVNLSSPSDARLTGGIELNPTIVPGGKADKAPASKQDDVPVAPVPNADGTAPKPPAAEADEISLDDLDNLLKQEMPEFDSEINSLREAGKDLEGKNINLSATDVQADATSEIATEDLPSHPTKLNKIKDFMRTYSKRILLGFVNLPKNFFKYLVLFIKRDAVSALKKILAKVKEAIMALIASFKSMSGQQKLILLALFFLSGAIVFLLTRQFHLGNISETPFLENFAKFGQEFEYAEKPFVFLSEEGQYPENVVLLDKVVANIRPSKSSGENPMMAVRFYFEVTTREGAIELKDRQKEVRDLVQRVLEEYTYDQVVSAEGKKAFKESLRRELSSILNTGIVKNVFIDDILLKP